jgi:hypothetical protein
VRGPGDQQRAERAERGGRQQEQRREERGNQRYRGGEPRSEPFFQATSGRDDSATCSLVRPKRRSRVR